jgi:hypothetical protein
VLTAADFEKLNSDLLAKSVPDRPVLKPEPIENLSLYDKSAEGLLPLDSDNSEKNVKNQNEKNEIDSVRAKINLESKVTIVYFV